MNSLIAEYLEKYSSPESPLLMQLNRETHLKTAYPRMLSGHLQGRVLAMLSKMVQPKAILEIGTFTGYSALCLAEGLAEGGVLHTVEINPEFEEPVKQWITKAGMQDKIIQHLGDAALIIPDLLASCHFDLVFLDADKERYPLYFQLLRAGLPNGAFIIADNVLWDGKVALKTQSTDAETLGIQEFNRLVQEDQEVENVMLPVRDGLSLIKIL